MTREMMLGMLDAGKTGNQLLAILDILTGDVAPAEMVTATESAEDSYGEPTAEWVNF